MQEFTASRTALGVSLLRAEHARSDPDPVIADPWGDRLVPEAAREAYRRIALARLSPETSAAPDTLLRDFFAGQALYGSILLRARWSEDALAAEVADGVRQYVLVGAGFDSFCLRRPDFARDLEIFEIDHPATQALKLAQLDRTGLGRPDGTHFIAADLANEDVGSALSRAPFRRDERAVFTWLGVTVYLTREANMATLRAIATCAAPGSLLAFTYADAAIFQPRAAAAEGESLNESTRMVARLGEPFVSGFDPAELPDLLAGAGLELIEDLNGPALAERYGRVGRRALPTSVSSRCALARVREGRRDQGTRTC